MTTRPSEQENGRMVLDMYSDFNVKPGEALRSNNFLAWAERRRIRIEDLSSGLDYAVREGWLSERSDGYLTLTESGFQIM